MIFFYGYESKHILEDSRWIIENIWMEKRNRKTPNILRKCQNNFIKGRMIKYESSGTNMDVIKETNTSVWFFLMWGTIQTKYVFGGASNNEGWKKNILVIRLFWHYVVCIELLRETFVNDWDD